jgi:hypothetical protein
MTTPDYMELKDRIELLEELLEDIRQTLILDLPWKDLPARIDKALAYDED